MASASADEIKYNDPNDKNYGWLCNMSPHSFVIDDIFYKSVEHYVKSQKFKDTSKENIIRNASTPWRARKMSTGRISTSIRDYVMVEREIYDDNIYPRSDWENVKYEIYNRGINAKFSQNEDLQEKLKQTHPYRLVPEDDDTICGEILEKLRQSFLPQKNNVCSIVRYHLSYADYKNLFFLYNIIWILSEIVSMTNNEKINTQIIKCFIENLTIKTNEEVEKELKNVWCIKSTEKSKINLWLRDELYGEEQISADEEEIINFITNLYFKFCKNDNVELYILINQCLSDFCIRKNKIVIDPKFVLQQNLKDLYISTPQKNKFYISGKNISEHTENLIKLGGIVIDDYTIFFENKNSVSQYIFSNMTDIERINCVFENWMQIKLLIIYDIMTCISQYLDLSKMDIEIVQVLMHDVFGLKKFDGVVDDIFLSTDFIKVSCPKTLHLSYESKVYISKWFQYIKKEMVRTNYISHYKYKDFTNTLEKISLQDQNNTRLSNSENQYEKIYIALLKIIQFFISNYNVHLSNELIMNSANVLIHYSYKMNLENKDKENTLFPTTHKDHIKSLILNSNDINQELIKKMCVVCDIVYSVAIQDRKTYSKIKFLSQSRPFFYDLNTRILFSGMIDINENIESQTYSEWIGILVCVESSIQNSFLSKIYEKYPYADFRKNIERCNDTLQAGSYLVSKPENYYGDSVYSDTDHRYIISIISHYSTDLTNIIDTIDNMKMWFENAVKEVIKKINVIAFSKTQLQKYHIDVLRSIISNNKKVSFILCR